MGAAKGVSSINEKFIRRFCERQTHALNISIWRFLGTLRGCISRFLEFKGDADEDLQGGHFRGYLEVCHSGIKIYLLKSTML